MFQMFKPVTLSNIIHYSTQTQADITRTATVKIQGLLSVLKEKMADVITILIPME